MAGKEQTVSELAYDKWIGAFAFIWAEQLMLMNSIQSLKPTLLYCVTCFVMGSKAFETKLCLLDKHIEEQSLSRLPCYKIVSVT